MQTDVIVIGAGPVGLLLANLLSSAGIDTVVVEKRHSTVESSRAIGITPPSLEILEKIELHDTFVKEGVQVQTAVVHGAHGLIGKIDFSHIPGTYPFILSFPQKRTEEILSSALTGKGSEPGTKPGAETTAGAGSVRVLMGREMVGLHIESGGISVDTVENETDKTPDRGADSRGDEGGESGDLESPRRIHGRYLCACDGFRSSVRSITGAAFSEMLYADTFLMGDYRDRSSYGSEAHLFFTARGSVESFPLPGGRRRWIIQTPRYEEEPGPGYLEEQVRARTGFLLHEGDRSWISPFRVHRRIMDSFYQGRILFLGDAAHTISPIGGQGMNTGFADAEFAAALLESLLGAGRGAAGLTEHKDEHEDEGEDEEARRARLFPLYSRCRRKAALTAARRATLSMKTGTIHGRLPSGLRNLLLKLLLASPLAGLLPGHYAMLTIPCRNLRAADSSR